MTLTVTPIGTIRTPFRDRYDAPRQPGVDGNVADGVITLLPNQNFEQALEDLSGFERIWLIYWFNRNDNWRPKVQPPRSEKRRGVFATRSPHRPNPIGLSLVNLLKITGRELLVGNVDLLDETPILDIKPYLPEVEAYPNSRSGWLDELPITQRSTERWTLRWGDLALRQAKLLRDRCSIDFSEHTSRILSTNPFPHASHRIEKLADERFMLAWKSWRLIYTVTGDIVEIEGIESGYSMEAIQQGTPDTLHDFDAHLLFTLSWPTQI